MNMQHKKTAISASQIKALRKLLTLILLLALLLTVVCSCKTTDSAGAAVPALISAEAPLGLESSDTPSAESSKPSASDVGSGPLYTKITVTFYGDTATSRGFTWYTSASIRSSDLQVTEQLSVNADFDNAMMFAGTVSDSHNTRKELVHKAEATGLKSDTTYFYRVGNAETGLWSEPAVFTTAPESGAFSFIDISDTQAPGMANLELIPETLEKALDMCENAGFIVNNGDNADSSTEAEWNKYLDGTTDILNNTTVMPAAGNHDSGNNCFIDHYNLDAEGETTATGAYYSVTYCNAHFVVLNTNDMSVDYLSFTEAQLDWMAEDISDARSAGAVWIIVVMHMGPYSTGSHAGDAPVADTRKKVAPLFDDFDVDLVLQGHDHVYDRSKPIVDGEAVPIKTAAEDFNGSSVTYLKSPGGPIYITPATAGTKHYYQNTKLTEDYLNLFSTLNAPKAGDKNYNTLQTFMCFNVDGNKLTATAYQFSPAIDNGTPYIIDQFGIIK